MGFAFTMVMTFLTTTAVWLITKAFHVRWGTGTYSSSIGAPMIVGATAGVSFFFWADVSMLLFNKG